VTVGRAKSVFLRCLGQIFFCSAAEFHKASERTARNEADECERGAGLAM
jgi:hypothetical protein